jgi:predicted nucleic acid-binding protein
LVISFIDTNILVYCFINDPKKVPAQAVLGRRLHTGVQALNEMVNVLRKGDATLAIARNASRLVREVCAEIHPLLGDDHVRAMEIMQRYRLQWWDALLVATALRAGATNFYSEDMHTGLLIDNQMTIINPFLP